MSQLHTLIPGLAAAALLLISVGTLAPARADTPPVAEKVAANIALTSADVALAPASTVARRKKPYSPYLATYLSLLGTGGLIIAGTLTVNVDSGPGPALVALAGVIVAPSFGHMYTRDWRGAFVPMGMRVSGMGLMIFGIAGLQTNSFCFEFCPPPTWEKLAPVAMIVGIAGLLGGGLYSFFDAGASARRQNRKRNLLVAPAPMLINTSDGRGLGLSLTGRF